MEPRIFASLGGRFINTEHGSVQAASLGVEMPKRISLGNDKSLVLHGGADLLVGGESKTLPRSALDSSLDPAPTTFELDPSRVGFELRSGATLPIGKGKTGIGVEAGVRSFGSTHGFVRPKASFGFDAGLPVYLDAGLDLSPQGLGAMIGIKIGFQ